ncbi:hypothetical protein DSO57_1006574 [Entomophthora muscae]|uniref:Uncharacterized protein n=1 Tax=Entomophthora muscae TaxID=34485 RepID=A0ACC2TVR0_9FUNG|nr:hypothetical protein DSO57_1006574 [Entomophthora muscae]
MNKNILTTVQTPAATHPASRPGACPHSPAANQNWVITAANKESQKVPQCKSPANQTINSPTAVVTSEPSQWELKIEAKADLDPNLIL